MYPTTIRTDMKSFCELAKKSESIAIFKSAQGNGVLTYMTFVNLKAVQAQVSVVRDGFSHDPIFGGADQYGHSSWHLNEQRELVRTFGAKTDLVRELTKLGMKKEQLDVLNKVKVNELHEFADNTSVAEPDEQEFQANIKNKIFRQGFEIVHPLVKVAQVKAVRQNSQQLHYTITVPFDKVIAEVEKDSDLQIAGTNIPVYRGWAGNR